MDHLPTQNYHRYINTHPKSPKIGMFKGWKFMQFWKNRKKMHYDPWDDGTPYMMYKREAQGQSHIKRDYLEWRLKKKFTFCIFTNFVGGMENCLAECDKHCGHRVMTTGSHQKFSCIHACKFRELGLTKTECKSKCIETGCSPVVNGFTFDLCRSDPVCPDDEKMPKLEHCELGCDSFWILSNFKCLITSPSIPIFQFFSSPSHPLFVFEQNPSYHKSLVLRLFKVKG